MSCSVSRGSRLSCSPGHFSKLALLIFVLSVAGSSRAATIIVPTGGNFQAALNVAQPGDTIVLQAGASYVGSFSLPLKGGSEYITIQSSRLAELPGEGQRVSPAHAPLMPRILSPGLGYAALVTAAQAHHYKLIGVEIAPETDTAFIYDLISLGEQGYTQKTLDSVPHHLIIDRSYIHTYLIQGLKRGIALNSGYTEITNSYIAGFKAEGQDSQAICGWNGPGPYKIINNYLEAAGENVMFGGAPAAIPNLVPSDIEIRRNNFFKPLRWRVGDPSYGGTPWSVKNLFELKTGRRVVIEGNVFENNWAHAQAGFAILFNSIDDTGGWARIEDVTFANNIVRHSGQGFNIRGHDATGAQAARITIRNNLFDDISSVKWGGDGRLFQVYQGATDVVITHNTGIQNSVVISATGDPSNGFVFTNNLARHNALGVFGDMGYIGTACLNQYYPGWTFAGNALAELPADVSSSQYPTNNFFPTSFDAQFVNAAAGDYRLAPTSPYKGQATDGKDIGCDFDELEAVQGGLIPTPTPTPSPSPSPSPTSSPTPPPTPSPSPTPASETVWVDDSIPMGAIPVGDGEQWNWVGSSPSPVSGGLANQSVVSSGMHQHYFYGAINTLSLSAGDTLIAYVFIDPANIPSQIMLQWYDGDWDQRAYWGTNNLNWGTENTNNLRRMGPLPPVGQWVRLEVPASQVGLAGRTVNGMAFTLYGGRATWDRVGKNLPAVNGLNPIDLTDFFVHQHYLDFLGRQPDPAGLAGWQNLINNCPPGDTTCDRIHVSSSFYQSPEFRERGYFVYRFYSVSFGRKPDYGEFTGDFQKVSGFLSDTELEAAKMAFLAEFMARPSFVARFNGLNNRRYVERLLSTAGISHPNRDLWIAALDGGTKTRAQVLRELTESSEVYNKYFNQAFVVMQYFGYLRRQPDAQYLNWISYLDSTGDFRSMISGFMNSTEYRARFAP